MEAKLIITDEQKPEIKPRKAEVKPQVVNGEPFCSGRNCSYYMPTNPDDRHCSQIPGYIRRGYACIPGLRQQRDELKCEVQEIRGFASSVLSVLEVAAVNLGQDGAVLALKAIIATNDKANTKLQTIRTLIDEEEWNADFRQVLLDKLGDGK